MSVRDAIRHTDGGTSRGPSLSAVVDSHDVEVFVLTPV
jgi:hypothetical protein